MIFSLITSLLLIIDNNIERNKNGVQWEESANQFSMKSNNNWQSYGGPKFAKNGWKYDKLEKLLFLFELLCLSKQNKKVIP